MFKTHIVTRWLLEKSWKPFLYNSETLQFFPKGIASWHDCSHFSLSTALCFKSTHTEVLTAAWMFSLSLLQLMLPVCPLQESSKKKFIWSSGDTFHSKWLVSHCTFIQISVLICYFNFKRRKLSSLYPVSKDSKGKEEVRKWQEKSHGNGNSVAEMQEIQNLLWSFK